MVLAVGQAVTLGRAAVFSPIPVATTGSECLRAGLRSCPTREMQQRKEPQASDHGFCATAVVIGFAVALSLVLGVAAQPAFAMPTGSPEKDWTEVADYLRMGGATISSDVSLGLREHGGALIRSLVATRDIPEGTRLFSVPKKLMITLDNYPDLLAAEPACSAAVGSWRLQSLKEIVAVAMENQRGSNLWLKQMPSLTEFQAFHPVLARLQVQRDFQQLPLMERMHGKNAMEGQQLNKSCFDTWKRSSEAPPGLPGIDWDTDMQQALASWQSRQYGSRRTKYNRMVPPDFANCTYADGVNMEYFTDESDTWSFWTKREVKAGEELFENYCSRDNEKNMESFGVYLEDNPAKPPTVDESACRALQPLIQKSLDAPSPGTTARVPKCKATTSSDPDQGPLRCNLARLAYEQCRR